MNCDKQLLELYVDDFLTNEEKREVEKHVEKCATCKQQLVLLQQEQVEIVAMLNRPKLKASLADDIMAKIEQPIVKKRRWQIPLTIVAAAMLTFSLAYLNRDDLFSVIDEQQQTNSNYSLAFEEVNVETGVIHVSYEVQNNKGEPIEPEQLASVKVLNEQLIDITDSVSILVNKTDQKNNFVIQLPDLINKEVTIQFNYSLLNISENITVQTTTEQQTTLFEHFEFIYQGKRFLNEQYEMFYKVKYEPKLQQQYEQLQQQLVDTYGNIMLRDYYYTQIQASVVNGEGTTLIGERHDTSWEGSGITTNSGNTLVLGEFASQLIVPEKYAKFPLTMTIEKVNETYPIFQEVPVKVNEPSTFEVEGVSYNFVDVSKADEGININITGPTDPYVSGMYISIDGTLHYAYANMDHIHNKYVYYFNVPDVDTIPQQFELIFTRMSKEYAIDPVEIIFP